MTKQIDQCEIVLSGLLVGGLPAALLLGIGPHES